MLPRGGNYRFDQRQANYNLIKGLIPDGSKVFDYACGLGVIDIQLSKEKGCKVYGCDYSAVAVEYVNMNIKNGEFRHTDDMFGSGYDFVLAIAYIEHTKTPTEWIKKALTFGKTVIATIPNNYRRVGEHIDMQWGNEGELDELLKDFKVQKVRDYKNACHTAWQSPILIITKEGQMHPSYIDSSTGEDKKEAPKKKINKSKVKSKKPEVSYQQNVRTDPVIENGGSNGVYTE